MCIYIYTYIYIYMYIYIYVHFEVDRKWLSLLQDASKHSDGDKALSVLARF